MSLSPKPFEECLQILRDSLIEYFLFRLSAAVGVGLAVEDSTLHALLSVACPLEFPTFWVFLESFALYRPEIPFRRQ
jgi:hypothetical protein